MFLTSLYKRIFLQREENFESPDGWLTVNSVSTKMEEIDLLQFVSVIHLANVWIKVKSHSETIFSSVSLGSIPPNLVLMETAVYTDGYMVGNENNIKEKGLITISIIS